MITTVRDVPPLPIRPRQDEDNHPALDDDILYGDIADTPPERTAEEFRTDEATDRPPPPPDEARG